MLQHLKIGFYYPSSNNEYIYIDILSKIPAALIQTKSVLAFH